MPLNKKGRKILANMKRRYGADEGESVFYASIKSGKISGVHENPEDEARVKGRKKKGE